MFNWTAFPESLDNNYDELESSGPVPAAPSTPVSSPSQQPTPAAHLLALPRSASTSQIDPTSPTPHFETANANSYPLSTGSRSHQRTPGVVSLSESSSLISGASMRLPSTPKLGTTLDSISNGLKAPPNSSTDGSSIGLRAGSHGQQLGLSLEPSSMAWWSSKKRADVPDFVLISEFSEVEGPRAVMTIPDNTIDLTRDSYSSLKQRTQESSLSSKHSHDVSDTNNLSTLERGSSVRDTEDLFDIHEFVLRITSVDQQARETSGAFHIPEDIEVHVSDAEKGYWAYVHHFTLFDVNARGFVRPFCMSYITRDPEKILRHYDQLRTKFSRAALYFKTGNYTLFRQDLTKKLRDLNYTNNLLSEAPADPEASSETLSAAPPEGDLLSSEVNQDLPLQLSPKSPDLATKEEAVHDEGLSEQQKSDLASIKDAIETATHIISMLEHYSVDGQPLLGHAEDGQEGPHLMVPLSDLSPMTSSENLAMLAAGRSGPTDPSLFLGASSRPGARVRRKGSTTNVPGSTPSRILDPVGVSGMVTDGISAPLPHLLGLQQEQSRKNSVASDYDSVMYEAPEYEAQYVTTLYPMFRDEVVFRPLRELCIAHMVWNSSIQFHLGVKKIKDILKEFQADSQSLGEAADSVRRMRPTYSGLTIGQRFMINFRNPDFNRITARSTQDVETRVPLMELLQGMSLSNAPSADGPLAQDILLPGAPESLAAVFRDPRSGERSAGGVLDAEDADDEQTGYDSLDDAASFFTAATGMAAQADTPTRDAFVISPLERSARVAEWHQEQQTLHHAKRALNVASVQGGPEQVPWSFGAGESHGEQSFAHGTCNRTQHRQSAQSGISMGMATVGSVQAAYCPNTVLDVLQQDPALAKSLVFALLSGKKVCVMGQSESETKIRAFISVLATFLPHPGYPSREEQLIEHQRQFVSWYQVSGLLQVEDMERLHLVGVDSIKMDPKFLGSDVCILDYDSFTWVNGRQYTDGILLESIFRNMDAFSQDSTFLAYADSKVFEILLKSFLYYHLVFHGRLYQGGVLAHPGAQAFYSSGASDDGEAFSYQHNFRGSRPSPAIPKSSGVSRLTRRNTSAYPSSTQLGTTGLFKNSRPASLSSQESSDAEKISAGQGGKESVDDARHESVVQDRLIMSGDESSLSGAPMQYSTSQGMRKWKKWFEYWSAKSVAMIDPALAAFGRSDSNVDLNGNSGSGSRRKRISGGRSSPHRRSKASPNLHASPGRQREVREREKERDRGRDRERNRKSTFDPFDVTKEKPMTSSSSDSESIINNEDMAAFEKEVIMDEKAGIEYLDNRTDDPDDMESESRIESRIDETHAILAEELTTITKNSGGPRRLKPKRPLMLNRAMSKSSSVDKERNRQEGGAAANEGALQRRSSVDFAASPPHSATFRSLAGAIRAMSFGNSSSTTNNTESTMQTQVSTESVDRLTSEIQGSSRNSRDLSGPSYLNKEMKQRGSTRAKAKAWLKSKRKRRSRGYEGGEVEQGPPEMDEHDQELSEEDEDEGLEGEGDLQSQDQDHQEREVEDSELTIRAVPESAPASALSSSMILVLPPQHSRSTEDLAEAIRPQIQDLPLNIPLTIQEIAAQEPTRIISRAIAPIPTSTLSSGNSSSRVSSANPSRITSPIVLSFAAGHRQRPYLKGSVTVPGLAATATASTLASLETRSEVDDSEYDPRRTDLGRESATEYETSLETFVGMDSGNMSSLGPSAGRRQSSDSFGRSRLENSSTAEIRNSMTSDTTTGLTDRTLRQPLISGGDEADTTVTLTEEEEAVLRDMLGGITGADDWAIIVHLATIVDELERSKGLIHQ